MIILFGVEKAGSNYKGTLNLCYKKAVMDTLDSMQ